MDLEINEIARAIARAGGRAILTGGTVRDRILGLESKDSDVEVYGLSIARLEEVLGSFGEVIAVGKSFGVLQIKGFPGDFSIPRKDSKTGRGHRGFLVEFDPSMTFSRAARRRDLTINAMGLDPLTGEILDPYGGRRDLELGVLRVVDPETFPEDSLRGLRVAQFSARFEMSPDAELVEICSALDLSDLPGERMLDEFEKLLLRGVHPSRGLEFLRISDLLRFFPELKAMVGVPQDPHWHPEGTVWEHVMLVVDEAAGLRSGDREEDLVLMFAALCHDLGKPQTTVQEEGRIRSPNHEDVGVPLVESFLGRLRSPHGRIEKVAALTRYHLAPTNFIKQGASPRAYRRLARKLGEAGLNARALERVARADHLGRTTPEALARHFPDGEAFLLQAKKLKVEEDSVKDVVMGRHLIARGMEPGVQFGPILKRCRAIQEKTGLTDPDPILDRALSEGNGLPPGSDEDDLLP